MIKFDERTVLNEGTERQKNLCSDYYMTKESPTWTEGDIVSNKSKLEQRKELMRQENGYGLVIYGNGRRFDTMYLVDREDGKTELVYHIDNKNGDMLNEVRTVLLIPKRIKRYYGKQWLNGVGVSIEW